MVSKARDDLPEPDSPVNTMSRSRGRSTDTFCRLCSRAPRTTRRSDIPLDPTERPAESVRTYVRLPGRGADDDDPRRGWGDRRRHALTEESAAPAARPAAAVAARSPPGLCA